MPNHKSPGIDYISYESLKYGGHVLFEYLAQLYNAMLKHIHIPVALKHSLIIPIYKGKRKPKDNLTSYRGISLSPIINKILEKVILNRLKPWLKIHNFPPNLQQSGRQGTSCVSLSYMVLELIHHFTSRGRKVFAGFVDIQQAFDSIWWDGLLYKMSRIGIQGNLWWLLREWLIGSTSNVLINGELSDTLTITRSIKQGGLLSMFFFCVAYYDIHEEAIRSPAQGIDYHNVDVSTPTFADDTLLLSLSVRNLQLMLNNVHHYGNRWRIRFSPSKSYCMTFGESKSSNTRNRLGRKWLLGNLSIQEVDHCLYLGNKICSYNCSMVRTQDMSKKGYKYLGMLNSIGFNADGMNPLTSAILWHRLCIPSMLFACEVWGPLTRREYDILEKVQRTVAKHIQGLNWRTHNAIVLGLLGWHTIQSSIHKAKLLFLRQLLSLPSTSVIKHVLLHQLYEQFVPGAPASKGSLTADYVSLVSQYGLNQYVKQYLNGGQFPYKQEWKTIAKEQIASQAQRTWYDTLVRKRAHRYADIQPILNHNVLYDVIRRNIKTKSDIMFLIQLLSVPDNCNIFACNLCGKQTDDYVEHILTRCEELILERDKLWEDIVNVLGVEAEVELFRREDEDIIRIMLGKKCNFLNDDQYDQFIIIVARAVRQLSQYTNFRKLAVFRN